CLVEAVGAIASSQKEGLVVSYVAGSIRNKMELLGHNPEAPISQQDFQSYLTDPEVTGILASVKVDVVVLADMLEMFYEDLERTGDVMTFEKMVELMLNGRGSNTATVRDTKELLRMIKS
ncbi:DUSP9, partial [Symbiodinium necroappetens]